VIIPDEATAQGVALSGNVSGTVQLTRDFAPFLINIKKIERYRAYMDPPDERVVEYRCTT
jgi:hypothetical protein